jgi:site-specific DNA recombinase
MAKTIGYIRVSTEGQVNEGVSLDMQEAKIHAYCLLNDLELSEVICDAGISGKNLARPGIKRVLDMVRAGEVGAVVIYKLDRLGRSTSDLLEVAKLMAKKGVAIHSLTEKLDTTSAVGRFFFTLTSGLAEMERGLISERTKAALAQKKSKSERISRFAPYGYKFNGNNLIPCKKEQLIISKIKELTDKNYSIKGIINFLYSNGFYNRKGNEFGVSAIWKLQKAA